MATSFEFIEFVSEHLLRFGEINYKKMFGEYMVYLNGKQILTVCDNTVFVKKIPEVANIMANSEVGFPYDGAKECYILDIEDSVLVKKLIPILYETIPFPKSKKSRK